MPPKQAVLGGRESVKVAVVQISPAYLDPRACVDRACAAIAEAAGNGAELVVFPEVWLAGYPYWTEGWDSPLPQWIDGRVRFHDAAVTVPGAEIDRLCAAARAANAHVVMGMNEMDERPGARTVYNTLLYIGRDGGVLGRHRKLIPTFIERVFWGFGDERDLTVVDTDIGRIGGLICGEHLMTTTRAAMIAQGEHIHVAVFPGAFALHTGPQLEEPDQSGCFWGHFSVRAHAMEAGAFVITGCGLIDDADIPDDFPYKDRMNTRYARGGSCVVTPLGVFLVEPTYGAQILYAELQSAMIKAVKAILDSVGHYARRDVLRLLVNRDGRWTEADQVAAATPLPAFRRGELRRAADTHEVEEITVEEIAASLGRVAP
ncbi:MAG: carbon-nitrogen hydrolase family protein [Gammaproteobacteria bacterium]|nr:carbon-nitrogen hydrolase family protein [Gammaproteobacteria bacterium]